MTLHVDVDIGSRGGEVPEAERTVFVQQPADIEGIGDDPGDIRSRRKAADAEGSIGVGLELLRQYLQIDVAIGVFGNGDDVGD